MRRIAWAVLCVCVSSLLLGAAGGDGITPSAPVVVQALRPTGVRISVPDSPGVDAVIINANINKPIGETDTGQVSGNVIESQNKYWTLEVADLKLKPGDIVFYSALRVSRKSLTLNGHQVIRDLVDPKCRPTPTTVNGQMVCAGELLLEDNFDTLNTSLWKHTIQFSDYPDHDFSTYTDSPENSFVKDGILHLRATPLKSDEDLTVPTKLEKCTRRDKKSEYCERDPSGWDILPPTRSAQLTTKGTFSIKFGRVEIRAKTADGDWLLSKLVLDPLIHTYGDFWFASGRIEILRSRGNRNVLEPSGWQLGARLNDPQADIRTCGRHLWLYKNCPLHGGKLYSDEMRVFTMEWTPYSITLAVDGECKHVINVPDGGFLQHPKFKENCHDSALRNGTQMAPFDKEFYLYIGLLVAGHHNYRNDVTNNGQPKPWKDLEPKAWLKFWKEKHLWEPTWKSDMEVDYVKVWAL